MGIGLLEMMGVVDVPKEMVQTSEEKLKVFSHIMDSMTKDELEDPKMIGSARMTRISRGSGRKTSEIRELLKKRDMIVDSETRRFSDLIDHAISRKSNITKNFSKLK